MLVIVSKALKAFIEGNVPPPVPEKRASDWVSIANLTPETSDQHQDCLLLNLFEIEPDPYVRNFSPEPQGGSHGRPHLPLALHYLITFLSPSAEVLLGALGGVLRAFHTEPTVEIDKYLPEEYATARAAGVATQKLHVHLETPDPDKISHLWTGMRKGLQLALYYRVSVAMVPGYMDVRTPAVTRPIPPRAAQLPRPEASR